MTDLINHPPHYAWLKEVAGCEPIDIAEHLPYNLGNALKYICRAGRKDGNTVEQDLQKARFYIDREITRIRGR